jgi:hypothetical protein
MSLFLMSSAARLRHAGEIFFQMLLLALQEMHKALE